MADVVIEAGAYTTLYGSANRGGPFWTSPTVGYIIYVDSATDLVYRKTSDGGATWAAANVLVTGAVLAYDCWADWQTPGDAGTKIHTACIDLTTNDVLYVSLDTSNGAEVIDKIEDCRGTGTFHGTISRTYHEISITKSRGGNLAVGFQYTDSGYTPFYGFYISPDGDTWTSRAALWEDYYDHCRLFPGNEADNQDVWAAYWDASANEISLKTFDNSGNSWSEQSISGSMAEAADYLQMDGVIRFSDGHLLFAAWNLFDSADADLIV